MKTSPSLFDTLQQLRSQQQNRQLSLMAQYQQKTKTGNNPTDSAPVKNQPGTGDNGKTPTQVDFSQMSAKQLHTWLQQGLSSGKIPPEQESVFKTLIFSASSGDSKNEHRLVNFSEKAQEGLQGALRRKDSSSMLFWANAVQTMKKFQGEKLPAL